MCNKILWLAAVMVALGGSLSAYKLAFADGNRVSTLDPRRPDCPGQIVCPISGELVCRDECPLASSETKNAANEQPQTETKSCCCQNMR